MKKTATIILNRNLPKETSLLVDQLIKDNNNYTDVYVVEGGSDKNNLSKYCSWHVNSKEVVEHGMRYLRGMNYGLLKLWESEDWKKYDLSLIHI